MATQRRTQETSESVFNNLSAACRQLAGRQPDSRCQLSQLKLMQALSNVNTPACACRWVDEVVRDAPWVINESFIDKHSIDYVTHDALPYSDSSGQANDVYDFVSVAFELLLITMLVTVW